MSDRKNGPNAFWTGAKIHFSKRDILGLGHLKLPDTLNFRGHFVKKEKKNDICVGIQFAFEMEKKNAWYYLRTFVEYTLWLPWCKQLILKISHFTKFPITVSLFLFPVSVGLLQVTSSAFQVLQYIWLALSFR